MRSGLVAIGVLSLVLASCVTIPTPQDANDTVLTPENTRRGHGPWPALMIVLSGIVPTFAWRARAEENVLSRTFGERYAAYGRRTRAFIPHVL